MTEAARNSLTPLVSGTAARGVLGLGFGLLVGGTALEVYPSLGCVVLTDELSFVALAAVNA
ncbi:MAG: hypothetical protein LCH60_15280 [Actinobacteria bacterium]|nr:hypothetical protein [Actinomycetota bacterium]